MLQRLFALACVAALTCGPPVQSPVPPNPAPAEPAPDQPMSAPAGLPEGAEARSLLGEPLFPPELTTQTRADREAKLAKARADHDADPADVEALIWLGRRKAYVGHYRVAIDIYSHGLAQHPNEARLYRHRGHRYITVRQFDDAIADLERAAKLIEGVKDEIEIDGLPNPAGIPTGTRRTSIYYHLGLAYYLVGNDIKARQAYAECLKASTTDDMRVAASYWLVLIDHRRGNADDAKRVLAPIVADMTIHENHGYHRLLLLFKGELQHEDVLPSDADDIQRATVGYGVARWHATQGNEQQAQTVLRQIIKTPQWPAFGYIAAEAELAAAK